jgi:hypothetical protein
MTPLAPPTVAVANIQAAEKFRLGPRIPYRGSVRLNSQRRGFIFDGQARLDFSSQPAASGWFAVQDSIDPKNMRIKLRDLTTEDGTPMLTGLFLSGSTAKVYPLFAAPKPDVTDLNIFKVDGTLSFNAKKRNYTIARHDANDINIYEGQVLKLDDSTGVMTFRGKMELIASNKDYALTAAGIGRAKPDSNRYELDTFLAFDINMPEKAIEAMANDLANNIKGAPEALDGSQNELYKLGEFIGSKAVQSYAATKGKYVPLQKLSSKFLHTLVLNKVNFEWSEKKKAWYSVGKIGLASVGKKDLNALIDGYIEIKRESTGDAVEIYLEAEPRTWYYIKYTNNVVLAKAQHGTFDEIISLKAKGDYNTATTYGFYLGDDQEVQLFLDHFRKDYLGEDIKKRKVAPISSGNDEGNFDNMEDTGKKKKKKKQEPVVDQGTTPAPDAPAEDTGRKKKKKDEAVDQAAPPTEAPVEEPKKEKEKKKKKKADEEDPFGGS